MFKKILIANRGEIACRVARSCKKLGIRSVGVYSDVDVTALHTQEVNEAYHIGSSLPSESYLNIPKLLNIIQMHDIDAVHPGYGFLAENYDFVKSLEEIGVEFIGPHSNAIKLMGDKIVAKEIAKNAGVSIVPGYDGEICDATKAMNVIDDIGFPVMLKAAAGGGGKGMRIVRSESNLAPALESTCNEARKNFGDGRVFIEKYIENPRHIEIQILSDKSGHCISLGERECSIQRNHQKVIEEAPSSFLDEETRKEMSEQAIMLAQNVGYYSAGTVEFIVDRDRNFYFLEMNTRVQVEHPVTEMVTGVDIIDWMFRIADGQDLHIKQQDVQFNGWAFESRIYAESPENGFLPSCGRIKKCIFPDDARVDLGVLSGSEVSAFYDSMIAKVCVHGHDRVDAITKMQCALELCYIDGIDTNLSFLSSIFYHSYFISGNISTNFIQQQYPDGYSLPEITENDLYIVALACAYIHIKYHNRHQGTQYEVLRRIISINEQAELIEIHQDGSMILNNKCYHISSDWNPGDIIMKISINDHCSILRCIVRDMYSFCILHRDTLSRCRIRDSLEEEMMAFLPSSLQNDTEDAAIKSPITGLLIKFYVNVGDAVKKGDPLFVLEAMKMENVISAKHDCKIETIEVIEGEKVHKGDAIMTLTPQ